MTARAVAAVVFTVLVSTGGAAAGDRQGGPTATTPDGSLYQLTGTLQDQTGADVRLDVHRGHPVLMSMFYASCTDACPLLIAELRRIESSLSPALRADVRVLLVSLDPAHDTPAALQRVAEKHRLEAAGWLLLTGTDDSVREVAAVLGVKFRRLSTGVINHSSVIAVLDRRGVIESRIDGITPGDPKLLARVTDALGRAASRDGGSGRPAAD